MSNYTSRDVSTGATGATEVAPKFSDNLTLSPPGGQILPTIAEVASKSSLRLRRWQGRNQGENLGSTSAMVGRIYPPWLR